MFLWMCFGVLGPDGATLNQASDERMITGKLAGFAVANEKQSAVANAGEIEAVSNNCAGRQCRAHAVEHRFGAGFLLNTMIGLAKRFQEALLGICFRRARVHLADSFDSDSAGVLPTFGAAHTVGDNGEAPETLEGSIILRLPVNVIVLVVFPMAPNIGEAGGLHSRTDFHSPLSSERQELYATA